MSEVTGIYGINKEKKIIESRVYVRHKVVDKKGTRYNVFAIPLSWDAIQYFEMVSRSVWTLLLFLIENQLLSFANEGRDFIPKYLALNEESATKIKQITAKITSYKNPTFKAVIKVNPPTKAVDQDRIAKAFKNNSIYMMKKDIFDVESLKKGEIS